MLINTFHLSDTKRTTKIFPLGNVLKRKSIYFSRIFIKRMRSLILVVLAFGFGFEVFAQDYTSIVHKKRADRFMFLNQYFYSNKNLQYDSIAYFKEIEKLLQVAEKGKDKELVLETEFLKYNYLSSRGYAPYIKEVTDLKKRLDKEGVKQLQARIRQALGFYHFYETKQYEKVIENFSQSYEYLKDLSYDDLPDKQEMIYNIAFVYNHIGYLDTALEYLKIAEKLTNTYYSYLPLNIENTKGMIMETKGEIDSSLVYYQKVYDLAEEKVFFVWKRIAENNIAQLYFSQKKYDKILEILKDEVQLDNPEWDINVKVKRYVLLASTLILLNREEEAISIIEKLEKSIQGYDIRRFDLVKVLPLKAYSRKKKGLYEEAYVLMDSARNLTEYENKLKINELVKQSEQKENIERYLRQQQQLENQKKINSIFRIGNVIIIILTMMIVYVFIQKQKTAYKNKQMMLELENSKMTKKLDSAEAQLKKLQNFLHEKRTEIQGYRNELEVLEQTNKNIKDVTKRKEKLNKLLEKAILTDESWLQFKKGFEEVYPDFIKKLLAEVPTLSQAEVRYIVLLKLELGPKEIASFLGIQPDSIRIYKYRIRKKTNTNDDLFLEKTIFRL